MSDFPARDDVFFYASGGGRHSEAPPEQVRRVYPSVQHPPAASLSANRLFVGVVFRHGGATVSSQCPDGRSAAQGQEQSKRRRTHCTYRLNVFSSPSPHLCIGNNRLLLFQMYVVSVLWSDQNDIVIYRTLRDFKKMHVSCSPPLIERTTSPG